MTTSPSPRGILVTSTHPFPSLPQPKPPAEAAQAVAEAAGAAASAWARPLHPGRHRRAVSQLYSTVRDLGIAARGLAAWQVPGTPAVPVPGEFAWHVNVGASRFLVAWSCLDGMLAFEGLGPLPDPDEPGAALCRAARNVIPAWRQPTGSSDCRDATVRAFIAATGLVSAGALGLAAYAPGHAFTGLQAAVASLAEAVADLFAAIGEAAVDPGPEDSTSSPLPGSRRPGGGELT
jgi:hypothetical protein